MKAREIRERVQAAGGGLKGQKVFVEQYLIPLLEGRKLPNGNTLKRKPEDFSIRALWEGLIGPVDETLPLGLLSSGGKYNYIREAGGINSTMFPIATGNIITNKVIEAYNMPGLIGDRLVTRMPSNLRSETIPGMTAAMGPDEVMEADMYKDSSIGEKYVTTETAKKGRLISVTEETIQFDRTGLILMRAQAIGEATAQEREKVILDGVTGINANVYKPLGSPATLYAAGHKNIVGSNPLVDWGSIEALELYHAANVKDDRQGGGAQPIIWMPRQLLVRPENKYTARRIVSATEIREVTNTNTTTISGNPIDTGIEVLSSPLIGGTPGDYWYGDFPREFIWQEIWPIQTFAQGASSDLAFERDIIARFKVRYYGGIAALDTVYVLKSQVAAL